MRGTIQSLGLLLWMTSFGCSTSVDVKPVEEECARDIATSFNGYRVDRHSIGWRHLALNFEVRDQNDNLIENNLTWSLESNIEEDLHTTNTTIMPVVAGEHTLSAFAPSIPQPKMILSQKETSVVLYLNRHSHWKSVLLRWSS